VSTTIQTVPSLTTSRLLPAIAKLSERDFRVCENCSGPAMLHPRYEMAVIATGESKRVLCCACLHTLSRHDSQIWECLECGQERAWGFGRPWDSTARPALGCEACGAVTRHAFQGVVGRAY
jgi:ribosomal protein L37AE/L43A